MKNWMKFIVSILICQAALAIGFSFASPAGANWYSYEGLAFTPPNWILTPGAIVLFLLMGLALYLAWQKNWRVGEQGTLVNKMEKSWNPISEKLWSGSWREENAVAIFAVQLILTILWPAVYFGLKFPGLAFFEVLMLWVAVIYAIMNLHRISKVAAYLLVPYFIAVSLVGYLNFSIWQVF